MSGDWPPEWDDPEEEFPPGAEQQDAAAEARLAEVSAYLASVPAPVLPDAVAARISAALVAEATARAGDGARAAASSTAGGTAAGAGTTADGDRPLGTAPARARVKRRRGGAKDYHGSRSRPLMRITSVMAGLAVIAGIGYGISRTGGAMSSSSGPGAGSAAQNTFAAAAPEASASSSSAAASSSSAAGSVGTRPQFLVTVSGTKYQAATLAAQVRTRLPHSSAASTSPGKVPGPTKTSSAPTAGSNQPAPGRAPTTALRACVLHLTGGQAPQLVDRAIYQGAPVYVIASSSHVWVVGLGCTAANAELITSVPLGS